MLGTSFKTQQLTVELGELVMGLSHLRTVIKQKRFLFPFAISFEKCMKNPLHKIVHCFAFICTRHLIVRIYECNSKIK